MEKLKAGTYVGESYSPELFLKVSSEYETKLKEFQQKNLKSDVDKKQENEKFPISTTLKK